MMRDLHAAIRNQPPAEHSYDWDPLHMPGSVQSYGVLLVADPKTRQVRLASSNAAEILDVAATDIVDRSYLALSDSEREKAAIKEAVAADTILFPNPLRLTVKGRAFDAVFHSHAGLHLIEIEPTSPASAAYADMSDRAVEEMFDPSSVEELYQRAVRVVRSVTGFDRVMLYRFDARYNGQVLAESSREGIGSFLGLFFPSSDIGARVRQLYLENFTRYIPDIGAAVFPLVGPHGPAGGVDSATPVDLSNANLRSVQGCHIDYLKNMGVKASMSFSINVDNRLWGLFACHHYAPRLVSYDQRVVCEQTAMMFIYRLNQMNSVAARLAARNRSVQQIGRSLSVGAALSRRIATLDSGFSDTKDQAAARPMLIEAIAAIHAQTSWLLDTEGHGTNSGTALTPQQRSLLDVVEADGAAIVRHGRVSCIGDTPAEMAIFAIASMFGRELPDIGHGNLPIFATDHLCGFAPVAEEIKDRAAGILAASLSDDVPAYLIWFRREQIVHATWAGNPEDEARAAGATGANPRASFAAWKEDIRNLSRPWVLEDVEVALELIGLIRAAEGAAPLRDAPLSFSLAAPPAPSSQAAGQSVWAASRPALQPTPVHQAPSHQATVQPAHGTSARRVIRIGQF
jgi:light-regulated signal transduction histidine kinase (bacteriophytochrome)